jgi:hypothetical protein
MWATAALTWAKGEHTRAEPEHPEHALSNDIILRRVIFGCETNSQSELSRAVNTRTGLCWAEEKRSLTFPRTVAPKVRVTSTKHWGTRAFRSYFPACYGTRGTSFRIAIEWKEWQKEGRREMRNRKAVNWDLHCPVIANRSVLPTTRSHSLRNRLRDGNASIFSNTSIFLIKHDIFFLNWNN